MTQVLNLSDYHLILSDEHSRFVIHGPAQTSPPACARPASDRTDTARLADRDLQALRPAHCQCVDGPGHGPKRYLSTISRTGERPRVGYVPNAAHAEVREFLANFRKLREVLNEICAINAELLRHGRGQPPSSMSSRRGPPRARGILGGRAPPSRSRRLISKDREAELGATLRPPGAHTSGTNPLSLSGRKPRPASEERYEGRICRRSLGRTRPEHAGADVTAFRDFHCHARF
jgi:hypothetical protein